MAKAKIIIADDHPFVRVGLKELINNDPELSVVAEAENGQALINTLAKVKCDLAIIDIAMPQLDGIAALKLITNDYPQVKVFILSMFKDYQHFKQVMANGACGYMVKDDAPDQLVGAVKKVLAGKKYISPTVTKVLAERELRSLEDGDASSIEILTKREKQVLTMIAQGLANKNIASKLKISIRTVEHHRSNLTEKLGLRTTASLVRYAIDKGLV